jgi:hypothetical protein
VRGILDMPIIDLADEEIQSAQVAASISFTLNEMIQNII